MNLQELDNLTPEEKQRVIQELFGTKEEPEQQQVTEVSVTLPDGRPFHGTTEQLQQELNRIQAQRTQQPQQNEYQNQPQRPSWQPEEFNRHIQSGDFKKAMDYYNQANYGFDPGQVLPQMYQALVQLAQQTTDLQTHTFLEQNRAQFEPTPENVAAVNQIIDERGWPRTKQSHHDAILIAKSTGKIKDSQQQTQAQPLQPQTQQNGGLPPHLPGGGIGMSTDFATHEPPADLFSQVQNSGAGLDDIAAKIYELESQQRGG